MERRSDNDMNSELYTPYISAIIGATVAIIGWITVHHLNKQKSKEEKFIIVLEQQLTQINVPLIIEIENIFAEKNKDKMSEKFIAFMNKIESTDSPMTIESNLKTINSFKNLRSEYWNYKNIAKEDRNLELLLARLHMLYDDLSFTLEERQEVVFKNYDWLLRISKMGPTAKILHILFNSLFNIVTVIMNFLLIAVIFEILVYLMMKFHKWKVDAQEFNKFEYAYNELLQFSPILTVFLIFGVATWVLFFAYNLIIFKVKTRKEKIRKMLEKEDTFNVTEYRKRYPLPEYLKNVAKSENNEEST